MDIDPDLPPPGSDAAIDRGCICPVLDNGHGWGYMGVAGRYVYRTDCPLHFTADSAAPPPPPRPPQP